jgi:hypothetical protein
VRLVEEEHQLRSVEIADLRQVLVELRQQPQQKARVQARLEDQLVGREDVDDPAAAQVGAEQIGQVQRWLAEQRVAALARGQQAALDAPSDEGTRP